MNISDKGCQFINLNFFTEKGIMRFITGFLLLLILTNCSGTGYLTTIEGNQYRSISKKQYRVIAIHPTTSSNTRKAIKEFFSHRGYQVVNLKETFQKDFGYFLSVTCRNTGNVYDSSVGMYAEVVECSIQEGHGKTLVYKGKGKYNYLVKSIDNYHFATLASLQKFSSSNAVDATAISSENTQKIKLPQVKKDQKTGQQATQSIPIISNLQKTQRPQQVIKNWANNKQRRTALLIGNADYQFVSTLSNPRNDATDLAEKLKTLGFSVNLLINATQQEMDNEIHNFGRQLIKNGGIGLFYYAGHGIQAEGQNFLIPVDANVVVQKDVKYKAVHLGMIMDEMDEARNGLNIIILDACRNNPLPASSRSMARGLAQVNGPKGSFIAFATAPGETASDGKGRNGTYTKHLLMNIDSPEIALEKVFKNVAKGVSVETGNKQMPWVNSSFIGDFYFSSEN